MILIIDPDASKVIDAVRSTGVVITRPMMEYAHYIISNMKAIGTWQLSNAVYGFVGGTADSHKWNWKDLRDVDSAYRLSFLGGVTHSSNGIQGNGTSQYVNTFLPQNFNTNLSNIHTSFNSFTNNASANQVEMGVWSSFGTSMIILQENIGYIAGNSTPFADVSVVSANSSGYRILSRTSSSRITMFRNGIQGTINTGTINTSAISLPFYLLARNSSTGAGSFSNRGCSFSTIGAGLTDTQALQQSQIVTNAQAILNRA